MCWLRLAEQIADCQDHAAWHEGYDWQQQAMGYSVASPASRASERAGTDQ
jgi:hypothetical protein